MCEWRKNSQWLESYSYQPSSNNCQKLPITCVFYSESVLAVQLAGIVFQACIDTSEVYQSFPSPTNRLLLKSASTTQSPSQILLSFHSMPIITSRKNGESSRLRSQMALQRLNRGYLIFCLALPYRARRDMSASQARGNIFRIKKENSSPIKVPVETNNL